MVREGGREERGIRQRINRTEEEVPQKVLYERLKCRLTSERVPTRQPEAGRRG